MGPPPSEHARRRNVRPGTTTLPAEGRQGPPPRYPLGPDVELRARLTVARGRVDALEADLEDGKRVRASTLDEAREKVLVLEHVLEGQAAAEAELWGELWATPQAVEWARQRWTREVAMYVRWSVRAGAGDLDAAREARQHADRLGLTPMALLRLRWTIARDELADQRNQRTTTAAAPAPPPPKLKAVDDAG